MSKKHFLKKSYADVLRGVDQNEEADQGKNLLFNYIFNKSCNGRKVFFNVAVSFSLLLTPKINAILFQTVIRFIP